MFCKKIAVVVVICAICIVYYRQYKSGGWCHSDARIDNKVVLITGANTGIGKETALDLAKRGGRIIMACRTLDRCNRAANSIKTEANVGDDKIKVMHLDLSSIKSVRDFSEIFHKEEKGLHILINNAGVIGPHTITEDGFELTFQVNHLGHFLLTQLLLDRLKESTPSRVVTVSGDGHAMIYDYNFDEAYNVAFENYSSMTAYFNSKLANVLFSKELSKRLEGSGITTYSLHPGGVFTEIFRDMWLAKVPGVLTLASYILKTSTEGAQTQICCAIDPQLADETGLYYGDCVQKVPSVAAQNDNYAEKLWTLSEKLIEQVS